MNKFENVTVEDDTAIIISEDWKHGNIDCLFQVWIWDNIKGESLIFVADEVNDISDEELRDNPQIKDADQVTNHQLPPLVFACLTRYSLDGK